MKQMFFWKSLAFSMIQWILALWSLVPLPFLNPAWTSIWKFTVRVLLMPDLENFEHYFTSMWIECNCVVVWALFGIAFLRDQKSEVSVLVGPCNLFLKPIGKTPWKMWLLAWSHSEDEGLFAWHLLAQALTLLHYQSSWYQVSCPNLLNSKFKSHRKRNNVLRSHCISLIFIRQIHISEPHNVFRELDSSDCPGK